MAYWHSSQTNTFGIVFRSSAPVANSEPISYSNLQQRNNLAWAKWISNIHEGPIHHGPSKIWKKKRSGWRAIAPTSRSPGRVSSRRSVLCFPRFILGFVVCISVPPNENQYHTWTKTFVVAQVFLSPRERRTHSLVIAWNTTKRATLKLCMEGVG